MSRDLEQTLSAYVEGALPVEEAAALEARLEAEPELAREVDQLRAVLGPEERLDLLPVEVPDALAAWVTETAGAPEAWDDLLDEGRDLLDPVEPSAELTAWVKERAAEAAVHAADAASDDGERDVLATDGERLDLLPVEVPPALETWVRAQTTPAGQVIPFPRRELWVWRAAAAFFAAVALLSFFGARPTGDGDARVASLTQALEAAQVRASETEQAASQAAQERDARSASLTQRERELAEVRTDRDRLVRTLRTQSQALDRGAEQVAQLKTALARAQAGSDRDGLQRALADARAALTRERAALARERSATARATKRAAHAEAARARAASEERRLRQALADARRPGSTATVQVAAAVSVERWDVARGWTPLRERERVQPGDVVRGTHLQSRIRVGDRTQRLGGGAFVFRGEGLQPLPTQQQGRIAPPRARTSAAEPTPPQVGILSSVASGLRR